MRDWNRIELQYRPDRPVSEVFIHTSFRSEHPGYCGASRELVGIGRAHGCTSAPAGSKSGVHTMNDAERTYTTEQIRLERRLPS